jgi:hypothetical protein
VKLYRVNEGVIVEDGGAAYLCEDAWDELFNRSDLFLYLKSRLLESKLPPVGDEFAERILPPIVSQEVVRGGEHIFRGATTLAQLKRAPESLVEFLFRDNSFPQGCFLLTGTGIVPPDDFTLRSGDEIRIQIEPIGTLCNTVE